jgi:hypothetical protein
MKKVTIKMKLVLEVPDSFEIAEDPDDGFSTLKRGGAYFVPDTLWMQRGHLFGHTIEGPPDTLYETVDNKTAEELNSYTVYEGFDIEPGDTA